MATTTAPGTSDAANLQGSVQNQVNAYVAAQAAAGGTDPGSQVLDYFGFNKTEASTRVNSGVGPPDGQNRPSRVDTSMTVEDEAKKIAELANSSNPEAQASWRQFQSELALLGAYGADGKYTPGGWSKNDSDAVVYAMKGYLQSGGGVQTQANGDGTTSSVSYAGLQTFSEYVDAQAANVLNNKKNGVTDGQTPGAVNQYQVSDPASIDEAGDQAAQTELGRSLSSDEQGQLVNEIQGRQAANGKDQTSQQQTAVDPSAVARQFVVDNNLPEYAQHQAESYMNLFANMFLPTGSNRANTVVGDVALGG